MGNKCQRSLLVASLLIKRVNGSIQVMCQCFSLETYKMFDVGAH